MPCISMVECWTSMGGRGGGGGMYVPSLNFKFDHFLF